MTLVTESRIHLYEVQFPVSPLHPEYVSPHVDDETFTIRFLLFTHEEIALIYSVDHPIIRNSTTYDLGEGGKEIHLVNNFIAGRAGRYFIRPSDNKRNSQGSSTILGLSLALAADTQHRNALTKIAEIITFSSCMMGWASIIWKQSLTSSQLQEIKGLTYSLINDF
jgi:hypothetical protein